MSETASGAAGFGEAGEASGEVPGGGVLAGRGAIVTGGSRGIGRAIVERLVADGAAVVFSYVSDEHAAREVAAAGHGRAWAVRADQADMAAVRGLFAVAEQHLDGLDILVNNAAVGATGMIAESTEDEYDRVMTANVKAVFVAMGEAARRMRDGGRIINISTLNTAMPAAGAALYSASKGAVEQFAAVAATELGSRGITVNSVSPGATDTAMLHAFNDPASLEHAAEVTPLGRLGRPADIADVVAFLAGPDARWITGQNLRATGGLR